MAGIIRLSAENIKRLKAVEFTPEGRMVGVGGRNGQGKTSVIDSIIMALGGKRGICDKPVRDGQKTARIEIELENLIIQRTFNENGNTYLTVKNKEGAKFSSGQQMLDELVGSLSFDPLAFTRMDTKKQAETLRELLGIDTAEIEKKRAESYEARRIENAAVKECESQLRGIPEHEGVGSEEQSATALIEQIEESQRIQSQREEISRSIEYRQKLVADHKQTIDKLKEAILTLGAEIEGFDETLSKLPEPADRDTLNAELKNIEDTNRKARENAQRARIAEQREKHAAKAKAEDDTINTLDDEKAEMLQGVEYPVEGLGFDEEGRVTLNGLPFDQASAAEQIRVSVAMGLAMNPKLPVILIKDASLLDCDSLAMIGDLADQHDAQIWYERVGEGEECQVIIEDGAVKGAIVEEATEPATA